MIRAVFISKLISIDNNYLSVYNNKTMKISRNERLVDKVQPRYFDVWLKMIRNHTLIFVSIDFEKQSLITEWHQYEGVT